MIQENLVTLVNKMSGKGSVRIELKSKELNHLLSLITKRSGALGGTERKVNSDTSEVTSVPGVMTAAQLSKMNFKTLAFTGMWKGLFGEPGENFDLMIHGTPHMGKTSFLLKLCYPYQKSK